MTLVTRGPGAGFFVALSLLDGQGDTSIVRYGLTSADYATAQTDVAAVIAAINLLSDSIVVSYSLQQVYDENAIVPVAGAENAIKALMSFQLENRPAKANLSVPSPKASIFQATTGPDAKIVDLTNAGVVAFEALFLTGGNCYLSDGETADDLLKGRKVSRNQG